MRQARAQGAELHLPSNDRHTLARVEGIGAARLERYAEMVLEVLRNAGEAEVTAP